MSTAPPLDRVRRVQILSASSGAGHVRAGQALERAFLRRGDSEVEHIDTLAYVSKLFQRLYDKAYISMVRRAPDLMGFLYDRTDQPWWHPRRRLALDRLNTQPMFRLLKRVQPELSIATHFLPAEILAWLIAKKKLSARNAIVVTDYDVHAMWLCRTVDRYYVAIQESAEYLAGIGVPAGKVRVTGIPIEQPLSRGEARRKLRLAPDARILLIAAGGYGLGPIEQLVHQLLAQKRSWQPAAIAGKSETLRKHLEEIGRTAGKLPGRGRLAHRQGRRIDRLRGAGPRTPDGSYRANPRPGGAQRRSLARRRCGHSLERPPGRGLEDCHPARRLREAGEDEEGRKSHVAARRRAQDRRRCPGAATLMRRLFDQRQGRRNYSFFRDYETQNAFD